MMDNYTDPFVEVQSVSKRVMTGSSSLTLLDNINFNLQAGTSVAVLGASGSGKTTLLGLMAGLDDVSQGKIFINGHNICELSEDGRAALRANTIGFIFQNFQLLQSLNALENVMLPLELAGSKRSRELAGHLLERVGLSDRAIHYPNQLSGGEQQRCAIARAFATQPRLLFADEPTGNLDSETGLRIIDLLFEINAEHNTTLVIATHDPILAKRCLRKLELSSGHLVRDSNTTG